MKVEPRTTFLAILLAGLAGTLLVFLALQLPLEGYLTLLFPSFLLWLLLPFLVLRVLRKFSREKGQ